MAIDSSTTRMKALVVEDHPPTSQFLARSLSGSGHDAEVCLSAEDALKLLEEHGIGAFQLFVLDLKLPGMDGISLCRWIRSHQKDCEPYVIVGTGSDHSEELTNAFEAGADDYIEKPYSVKILSLRFAVAQEQIAAREERKRLNAELNHEKDFIAAVFDTAAAFIVALEPDGHIAKVNQATCELTELDETALEGRHFCDALLDPAFESSEIRRKLEQLGASEKTTCRFESQFAGSGGQSQSVAWLCRYVANQSDQPAEGNSRPAIVCVGTDITEHRKMEAQLAFLAERDPLTNLYNRSQLEPAVQTAINATRTGQPAAVLYVDLDDFKTVNDSAGHAAGDDLLQIVSATLARSVRPNDTVIRLGGDEFVLVLKESSEEQARMIASRVRTMIDELDFNANGRSFHITASIGAILLGPQLTVEDALGQADAACYASKNNGRNTITFAGEHSDRSDEITHDTEWRDRITSALASNAFDLWLQPIVSLQTGKPAYHEALLRLPADGQWHSPGQFMNTARRFNLLPEIDRAVVRASLSMVQSNPDLNLTVNLTGRSAADSRLPAFLIQEFRRAGLEPSRLLFEITESDFISDLPNAIERLRELRRHGFRFALDDFGQGYSSFSYLRKLPVEMVKIDGSYTLSLLEDSHSAAFIRAIADLAHSIGLRCVAEHVEDAASYRMLQSLGVDYAQGYHLGKPQPLIPQRGEPEIADGVALSN